MASKTTYTQLSCQPWLQLRTIFCFNSSQKWVLNSNSTVGLESDRRWMFRWSVSKISRALMSKI